jgi:hypothetical protein
MTLQTSSPSLLAAAREGRERSFWRELLGAIMEGGQHKVDEYLRDYLRRHHGEHPGAELSRRDIGLSRRSRR